MESKSVPGFINLASTSPNPPTLGKLIHVLGPNGIYVLGSKPFVTIVEIA